MPKCMRTIVRSVLGIIVASVLSFGLSACSEYTPAAPKPTPTVPANILSVTLNNDGTMVVGQPVFVTGKPALELRLAVGNRGEDKDPMLNTIVSVVNLSRTDLTQPMKLGSVVVKHLGSDAYGGYVDLLLPQGTYELQRDGKSTGAKFTVKPPTTPNPASVPK